ncbi:MAG: hypothetical protein JNG88_18185 [Phycisphaerales bacterium]|nr:hypothetical protein [Phycisphaerales bacterium]
MVRPAGQRSLAGFTVGDLVARQVYGDLYRATGEGRREVRNANWMGGLRQVGESVVLNLRQFHLVESFLRDGS